MINLSVELLIKKKKKIFENHRIEIFKIQRC